MQIKADNSFFQNQKSVTPDKSFNPLFSPQSISISKISYFYDFMVRTPLTKRGKKILGGVKTFNSKI